MAVTGATLGLPTTFVLPYCIRYRELRHLGGREQPPALSLFPACVTPKREMGVLLVLAVGFQLLSVACTVLVFIDLAGGGV